MKQKIEIWKSIKGFEKYQVSNLGNVKVNAFCIIYSNDSLGRKGKHHKERLLPQRSGGTSPYLMINFINKHRLDSKHFTVHRLVALTFIPNPENKPCVNHIDNNPLNNNLTNLEWCTYKENSQHSVKQGRTNAPKKVTLQYDLNGNFLKEWKSQLMIEQVCGIDQGAISTAIKYNKPHKKHIFKMKESDDFPRKIAPYVKPRKKGKKVLQYNLNGEFIKEWESLQQAAEYVGTSISNISMCCGGRSKSSAGFMWRLK